jgi:hypothetical protein
MPSDTLVTVALSRDLFDLVQAIAAGTLVIFLLGILFLLFGILAQIRAGARALDQARADLFGEETVLKLREAATHAEAMTRTLRAEAERFGGAVGKVSDRVDRAADQLGERMDNLDALLEVMQEEADSAFVESLAKARGVREGFSAFRRKRKERKEDPSPPLHDSADPFDSGLD